MTTKETIQWFQQNTTFELAKLVETGLNLISEHPFHHLELGIREGIYLQLGPQGSNLGYKRRVALANIVLDKIIPLWNSIWPASGLLEPMMERFVKLKGNCTPEEREDILVSFDEDWEQVISFIEKNKITDLKHRNHYFAESVTGLAVVQALAIAGCDIFMTNEEPCIDRKDEISDFRYSELHFYAAFAYAGGAPYKLPHFESGNPQKYKAFWEWWLFEALPHAWIQ